MKKLVFLTCDDLTGYITDDSILQKVIAKDDHYFFDVMPWNADVDWSRYNAAIIRTTWDYTQKLPEFLLALERINASGCKLYNHLNIVKWNAHKSYLLELPGVGIPIIPTLNYSPINSGQALTKICDWDEEKILFKPFVGGNASGIQVEQKPQDPRSLNKMFPVAGLIQPFLENIVDGELSFHYFGGEFSHAIRKVPKKGDFRVQEEHGATILPHLPTTEEQQYAQDIVKKMQQLPVLSEADLLYARIDLVPYQGQLCVMELELIEPSLYFRTNSKSAHNFLAAIKKAIG